MTDTSAADVAVELEMADDAGRTDIELRTPTAHVIVEAKQGWIVPGEVQLYSTGRTRHAWAGVCRAAAARPVAAQFSW